ncbi:hypothetical protein, partial [Pseudomonas avellanae]|uniref:hypothetical protein n=1 Tax=Pseudomonas avellanae TaxID=46257 RepID=UPI001ED9A4E2
RGGEKKTQLDTVGCANSLVASLAVDDHLSNPAKTTLFLYRQPAIEPGSYQKVPLTQSQA